MSKFFYTFLFIIVYTFSFGQSYVADSLIGILPDVKENDEKAFLFKEIAFYLKSSNPTKALLYANQSLELSKQNSNQKGIAEAYHTIGIINLNLADYEKALEQYLNALKIREEIQDSIGLGRSYNNIGIIHLTQNEFELANKYFNNGLAIRQDTRDTIGIIYSYINIGEVFLKQNNLELALLNFTKALSFARKKNNQKGIAFSSTYLGRVYQQQENPEKALVYYFEALKIWEVRGNLKESAANYIEIGRIKMQQNKLKEALTFLDQGLINSKRIGAKRQIQEAYWTLANVYAKQQNYKKAYSSQLAYDQIKDSIFAETSSKSLLELETKYEANKKEVKLLQKNKEINRLSIFAFIIILLLLLLLSWYLYSRFKWQYQNTETLEETNRLIQKKNQELKEYNSELEQLAFIVSHHLKEPLRNINSFSTLLKRRYTKVLDENGLEYIAYITKGVSQMSNLLADLLYYAEIRSKENINFRPINTKDIVDHVLKEFQEKIEQKSAKITIGQLPMVHSKTFFMQLLFRNLIDNSLKFNEKDIPIINIDCQKTKSNYLFSVKDNGTGIAPSYQEKVFDIFKQYFARKKYGGTGIGLAISKQIVLKHNGRIWLESELGQGAIFYFTIPIVE